LIQHTLEPSYQPVCPILRKIRMDKKMAGTDDSRRGTLRTPRLSLRLVLCDEADEQPDHRYKRPDSAPTMFRIHAIPMSSRPVEYPLAMESPGLENKNREVENSIITQGRGE
jgi:hypothetical protein